MTRPTFPESGDWWDAAYLIMWGANVPADPYPGCPLGLRGPLPRYQGCHREPRLTPSNTKFADEWLPAQAGTDAALAMAMGHVILKENYVDQRVEFFEDSSLTYTDLPFLVTLETRTV